MATKLKNLKITSTDLVTAGANPDAHIRLFKRKDAPDGEASEQDNLLQKAIAALTGVLGKNNLPESHKSVQKDAKTFGDEIQRERLREVTSEAWGYTYALSDSFSSIICDNDLDDETKRDMMFKSLDEFAESARNAIPNWAQGKCAENGAVVKSKPEQAAFDAYWGEYYGKSENVQPEEGKEPATAEPPESEPNGDGDNSVGKSHEPKKEETDTMKIDKSKMTPEEQAAFAEFEKKYGVAEPETPPADTPPADGGVTKGTEPPAGTAEGAGTAPELHPEVKKALGENAALAAQIEELKKSLELKDLTAAAKKYEVIGKKADELAPKLYALKKAGGTAYDDTIALLDEQMALVEKSGLFGEMGHNTSGGISAGGELGSKADEIRKSNTGMSQAEAFAKAYETFPDLAAQYEKTYQGRA